MLYKKEKNILYRKKEVTKKVKFDWIKLVEFITLLTTMAAVIITVKQYLASQDWERSKFAASHLEKAEKLNEVELAKKILDWRYNDFKLPKNLHYDIKDLNHTQDKLIDALNKRGVIYNDFYTDEEEVYLFIFDKYFDYIEQTEHYIKINLFSIYDVEVMCWSVNQMEGKNFNNRELKTAFDSYLNEYDFSGVLNFKKRCKALNTSGEREE